MQSVANDTLHHRRGSVTLTMKDAAGTPYSQKPVVVRQWRHRFLFGCSEFSVVPYANDEMQSPAKAEHLTP